jgi:hypothetical protein
MALKRIRCKPTQFSSPEPDGRLGARPQGWNERMKAGEYAILYSSLRLGSDSENSAVMREPFCSVFSTLADAEDYAAQQVALLPTLWLPDL